MSEDKPILGIETSENLCGAAVYFSEDKFFETSINLKNSHSEKIFDAIETVLKSAESELQDMMAIAVSAGPGSFTGLRIGMSAAKGIALGASLPIIPVPTFEAFALQLSATLPPETIFTIANKVNKEEIYFAKFQIVANSFIFVQDLKIVRNEEFKELNPDELIFGNAIKNTTLEIGGRVKNISAPNAKFVAKWAKIFGQEKSTYDFNYLEPNYIKNFIIRGKKNVS